MKRSVLLALLLALLLTPASAQAFDRISVPGKATIQGRIIAVSPTKVTIEVNREISVAVNEIASIEFDGQWLETELVSPGEVRATVPARLVQNVGTYSVRVAHRKPGWGKTNAMYLIVKFK